MIRLLTGPHGKYFKAFWSLYAFKTLAGVLLIVAYLTGADFVGWFKVPLVSACAVAVVFTCIYRPPINLFFVTAAGIVFMSFFVGAFGKNGYGWSFWAHVYTAAMMLAATSMGIYYGRHVDEKIDRFVCKVISVVLAINVATLGAYFYLHYGTGDIAYFGFDTEVPLVAGFALGGRQFLRFVCIFSLVLLSGKRAPTVSMLAVSGLYYIRNTKSSVKNWLLSSIVVVGLITGLVIAYQAGLLYRFEGVFSTDISDGDVFFKSTSGRSWEIYGVIRRIAEQPLGWLVGTGLGSQYSVDGNYMNQYVFEQAHFSHVSILTIALVCGYPVAVLLVGFMLYVLVRNFRHGQSKYYWTFLVLFVGGFFGATWLVEPLLWFFLGVNLYMLRCPPHAKVLRL